MTQRIIFTLAVLVFAASIAFSFPTSAGAGILTQSHTLPISDYQTNAPARLVYSAACGSADPIWGFHVAAYVNRMCTDEPTRYNNVRITAIGESRECRMWSSRPLSSSGVAITYERVTRFRCQRGAKYYDQTLSHVPCGNGLNNIFLSDNQETLPGESQSCSTAQTYLPISRTCVDSIYTGGGTVNNPSTPCSPTGPPPNPTCNCCNWNYTTCSWTCGMSPVIVNFDETDKFPDLTGVETGTVFNFSGRDGEERFTGWTEAGDKQSAFLALDRNGNGEIENGLELFGNYTVGQPAAQDANGFKALVALDDNKDGVVDKEDKAFKDLRLWFDLNHDGKSSPDELKLLKDYDVAGFETAFQTKKKVDQYGNQFRYRGRVLGLKHKSKWAYDVIFKTEMVNP